VPINPAAIEEFLNKPLPWQPQWKGATPDRLERLIYDSTGYPHTPSPKLTLRQHQLEGLAFSLYHRRALLYYDPQLGKTATALAWASHLQRARLWRSGKGLVIAHAPVGLTSVWQSEIESHSELTADYVRVGIDNFMAALDSDADLLVIPWSGLQEVFSVKQPNKKGKPQLYPDHELIAIAAESFSLVIIDEVHMAKNHDSLRWKIAQELVAHCQFRLGLTGTPIGRRPYAAWASTYLIDEGKTLGRKYYFFEEAMGIKVKSWFARRKWEWRFNDKLMPILNEKLASLALPYKRTEVKQIDIQPSITYLTLAGEQRKAYREAVERVVSLKSGDHIAIESAFIRLRQIASGFLPYKDQSGTSRTIYFPAAAKLEWLDGYMEALDSDAQIVIFHEFTISGELICARLKRHKISHGWLYGGTPDAARTKIVRAFQANKVQILVTNSAVGGTSIQLPSADYLIFYESPVSPIVRTQAEGRPLGERGTRPLFITDLVAAPIELHIIDLVKAGKAAMAAITRDRQHLLGEKILPKTENSC